MGRAGGPPPHLWTSAAASSRPLLVALATLALSTPAAATIHSEAAEIEAQAAVEDGHTEALSVLAASAEDIISELRAAREETDALFPGGRSPSSPSRSMSLTRSSVNSD